MVFHIVLLGVLVVLLLVGCDIDGANVEGGYPTEALLKREVCGSPTTWVVEAVVVFFYSRRKVMG